MSELVVALDALFALPVADGVAAAKLAELAGAEAVRVSAGVAEPHVHELRRAAACLELKMDPSPLALKLALEVRPDRVVLTEPAPPAVLRQLEDGRIPAFARVAPDVDAVKAAHAAGMAGVEFTTEHAVDLPDTGRRAVLERLGDASRLAAKLHLPVSLGGGLDWRTLGEFVERVPALARVVVGRALVGRAVLVGMEQAVRDLRARLR